MFALAASLAAPPAQPAQPTGLTALVPYAESRRSLIQRLTGERLRVHRAGGCQHEAQEELGHVRVERLRRHVVPTLADGAYFVQMHKAAGMTICRLAQNNGEKHDCNEHDQDTWSPGYTKTCGDRQKSSARLHMVERWVDTNACNMTQMILIRDPLDRLVANAIQQFGSNPPVGRIMDACKPNATVALKAPDATNLDLWPQAAAAGPREQRAPPIVAYGTAAWDNFLTRTRIPI